MDKMNRLFRWIMAVVLCWATVGCDWIYDDPSEQPSTSDNGFAFIDATSYTQWVYLDLTLQRQTTLYYEDTTEIPEEWHLALHRYDVKTHEGSCYETDYSSLEKLTEDYRAGRFVLPSDDQFVADESDSIIIDMSTMMEGYLTKAPSKMNRVMGRWLSVDLSTMPPIYTESGRVYLLRMADASLAAIRFTGYSNPNNYNMKGYISFDYIYPFE